MTGAPVLEEVLATLRTQQDAVRLNKFKVVGVFGSVARGDARPESDVDIVIEAIDPSANLFDIGGVWSLLNDALGRGVDVVELDALRPRFRASVERDLVLL